MYANPSVNTVSFDYRTNRPLRPEAAKISGFYTHRKTQYSVLA